MWRLCFWDKSRTILSWLLLIQTLPTYGYAKMYSGVNTQSFQKHITSQELTSEGLRLLGPTVITLAEVEGLDAHAESIRVRMEELGVKM